jgi:ATP-dependent helicase/nuclease subunit A
MSAVPADHAARVAAIDADRSCIVQAPAGSGKTEILVQRYLRLLSLVERPEAILAITFTRKAAAEMRDRILAALESAKGPCPSEPHRQTTWQLARDALDVDVALGWSLTATTGRFRVQTIDSLCSGLTRRLPILSGFGAPPPTTEDAGPLYDEAARGLLGELNREPQDGGPIGVLMDHLDGNTSKFLRLIAQALSRRGEWLRHILDRSKANREYLETALKKVVDHELYALGRGMPNHFAADAFALLRESARYHQLTEPADAQIREILLWPPGPIALDADGLPAWRLLASWCLTKTGGARKTLNRTNGVPAKSCVPGNEEQAASVAHKRDALALLGRIRDDAAIERALIAVRALPNPGYSDGQWQIVGALIQALPHAFAHLRVVFASQGCVDFGEYQHRALEALGTDDAPSDLLLSLDEHVQHILVDEFQDTSRAQMDLLQRLTVDWTPGDGRTLFVVGDPMQSIYRFREAEVAFFLQAWKQGIGQLPLTQLRLSANFRSGAGVVEWVNTAFSIAFPKRNDTVSGAVAFSPAQAQYDSAQHEGVHIHPMIESSSRAEATEVVDIVRQALTRAGETIAVLVRSRNHLRDLLPALREAGLSFQAPDAERLARRQVVLDLHALTRALAHAADAPAWLAVLRAPYCGLTLADIHGLFNGSTKWPQVVVGKEKPDGLSPDGTTRLEHVVFEFARARHERRARSLRETVEGLWLALGGPHCLTTQDELDDARSYFDLLERQERAGELADGARFEAVLKELFAGAQASGDDRVQIMTIHKAKGLEFDTVILPSLHKPPRTSSRPIVHTDEAIVGLPDSRSERHLLVAPIEGIMGDDPLFAWLNGLAKTRDGHESVRLLYVAATRARLNLHLMGSARWDDDAPRAPVATSLLHHLWPSVESKFSQCEGGRVEDEDSFAEPLRDSVLKRVPSSWAATRATHRPEMTAGQAERTEVEVEFDWAGENARHIGTLVHRYLERITLDGQAAWPVERIAQHHAAFRAGLRNLGVAEASVDEACLRVATALEGILEDPRGQWLLDAHENADAELAVSESTPHGVHNFVVDRTFVDSDNVRWIVDYKTGGHEGGDLDAFLDNEQERYRAQLEGYARVLAQLETRHTKLGLYFPVIGAWREWNAA